jgi:outer membrane immunogenic protein
MLLMRELGDSMRGLSIALVAGVSMVAFTPIASAADIPVKAPVYKAPVVVGYSWTGLYLGLNAGVGVSGTRATAPAPSTLANARADQSNIFKAGFTGGVQAGYNYQFAPNWVAGIEGDVGVLRTSRTVCNLDDCDVNGPILIGSKSNFFATARGRLGYAWDRSLIYATGGAAWVGVTNRWTDNTTAPFVTVSQTKSGWTAGGGIETALAGNWTVKSEYLYVNVGGTTRSVDPAITTRFLDFKNEYHVARVGLNYRFGDAMGAVAAYRTPPAAVAVASWTGLYLGLNAGVGVSGTKVTVPPGSNAGTNANNTPFRPDEDNIFKAGFTGGGQAGYNYQFAPNWVAGIEGDVGILSTNHTICNIADCSSTNPLQLGSKSNFFATARGRLGYAWGRSLIYATGGAAWVGVTNRWTDYRTAPFIAVSQTKSGWTVGGGIETALAGNWTVKSEYLYVNVGTTRSVDPASPGQFLDFKNEYHVARLGLNYRFGGSAGAGY